MKVAEVMTRGIDFVDPAATVQDAATRMAELDVGALIVGKDEEVHGILTDRDILVRVVIEGKNPSYVPVAAVMSSDVVGCAADDSVETVFGVMRERQFRRMPVYEGEKAVGVVTLSDLARHVESSESIAESLRELSEPHRSRSAPERREAEDAAPASGTVEA